MAKRKMLRYGGKTWVCTKQKKRDLIICSPKKKAKVYHHRRHKGHRTRRGLAQDQRLRSSEYHERYYRKHK